MHTLTVVSNISLQKIIHQIIY